MINVFCFKFRKEAQRCYCEAESCRGWIGEEPESGEEYEDDEEESLTANNRLNENDENVILLEKPSTEDKIKEPKIDNELSMKSTDDTNQLPLTMIDTKSTALKPKKETKQKLSNEEKLYKKHIKNKKAEILEDPDLDKEISILRQSNLKNQAHTLRFSRLMVRAKLRRAKSELLVILRCGELACRRLFLDYHGLKLLYTWMCDSISTDMTTEWEFRLEILQTLEVLPITNKTMLMDSKVLETVRKWSKTIREKEMVKSPDESQSDSGSGTPVSDEVVSPKDELTKPKDIQQTNIPKSIQELSANAHDIGVDALKQILLTNENNEKKMNEANQVDKQIIDSTNQLMEQIRFLAAKLVSAWDSLHEVYRIPKKQRIEQMKEHEREANRGYQALGLSEETENSSKRYGKERPREKDRDFEKERKERQDRFRRERVDPRDPDAMFSKYQRRQMFEARVKITSY